MDSAVELGGDIAVFNDVRNALGNAMEQIEGVVQAKKL